MQHLDSLKHHARAHETQQWQGFSTDERVARLANDWAVPVELVKYLVHLEAVNAELVARVAALEAKQPTAA